MADCFWTDLVGVEQECPGSPVGPSLGTLAEGYAALDVGFVTSAIALGDLAMLGTTSSGGVVSTAAASMEDPIWSVVGGEVAVATNGAMAVAVGQTSNSTYAFSAATTADGVSTAVYANVILPPGSYLQPIIRLQYHVARGAFYAVVSSGTSLYVYQMGSAAEWTLVYTVSGSSYPSEFRYIHATDELVLVVMIGVDEFHYRPAYHVLGATGSFTAVTPAFTVTAGYPVSLAYCAGVSKYVMALHGAILAASSLADEFTPTSLPVFGMTGYNERLLEVPGTPHLMSFAAEMCSETPGTIYTTDDLETTHTIFTGGAGLGGSEKPGNFPLVGFAPGVGAANGTLYLNAYPFCS